MTCYFIYFILPGPWAYSLPCSLQVDQLVCQLCGGQLLQYTTDYIFSYNEGWFWEANERTVRKIQIHYTGVVQP